MAIRSISLNSLSLLLFVFQTTYSSISHSENLVDSIQKYLLNKSASVSLIIKINGAEKDRYEFSILNGINNLIPNAQSLDVAEGIYRIDLPSANIVKLHLSTGILGFFADDMPDGFAPLNREKTVYYRTTGLEQSEIQRVVQSLITFTLTSLEKEHRQKLKQNYAFSNISKNKISPVQNKIYFMVGFLDFLDTEKHNYVLEKISPYFDTIKQKGFEFNYLPFAKVSDLISALNNEQTLAIYWISHSLTSSKNLDEAILLDADKNAVPRSIFTKSFRAKPISLAMIACYPEKITGNYDMDKMIENRNLTAWYTEGANLILKDSIIRPVEFESYLSSLPNLSNSGEKYYENQEHFKIEFEHAGAFPLSNKYYILLNGKYIGTVPYNSSPGFSKYALNIPKKFFGLNNEIMIKREIMPGQSARESLVYVKSFSVTNGNTALFQDQRTFKFEVYSSLSFFNSVPNTINTYTNIKFNF